MTSRVRAPAAYGPPEDLPDRLMLARSHGLGLRFLLTHLTPGDAGTHRLTCRARGRLLETALTLHLLRRVDIEPAWRERLRGFLLRHLAGADGMSRALALAALGREPGPEGLRHVESMMEGLDFGRRRKQALLIMLLVELGVVPLARARVQPEDFAARAVHRFSQLYGAALRRLHARHAGLAPAEVDAAFLESTQAANGSWEQQSLITLMAMLGLGATHPAFTRGLEFLRSVACEDGGIPFIRDHDVWLNGLGGFALQASNTQLGLRRGMARFLVSEQQPNGGWCFGQHVLQTDTDDTAQSVQMLIQEDAARFEDSIDRAFAYFEALRLPEGSYPTYEREGEPELTLTANILLVQSLMVHRRPWLRGVMHRTGRYLLEGQRDDGRFETSWSRSETYSLFRVLWALDTYHAVEPAFPLGHVYARALRYLLDHQLEEGGWAQKGATHGDALSTAYAIACLCLMGRHQPVDSERLRLAAAYLLRQQDPVTGEFVSVPDVVGPRPLPYDVPLMGTLFSVLALAFAKDSPHVR